MDRKRFIVIIVAMAIVVSLTPTMASAHGHGNFSIGIGIGVPAYGWGGYWAGPCYPYPYYPCYPRVVYAPPVYYPPVVVAQPVAVVRGDAITSYVNVTNSNGSITPVRIRRLGNVWVGPKGEQYLAFPTVEQLKPVYGF
jgi:hypothetical protein